ncbi:hypothetical protein MGH68_03030 [Erysipelothrix sp. D19-032]
MTHYDKIREGLIKGKEPRTLEVLIESFKTMFNLSEKEINKELEAMIEAQEIVLDEGVVYVIDNIHYAIGTFKAVRDTFGFVENEAVSIYVGSADFKDALDSDTVLVEIKSARKTIWNYSQDPPTQQNCPSWYNETKRETYFLCPL